jgi:hypothetical protein
MNEMTWSWRTLVFIILITALMSPLTARAQANFTLGTVTGMTSGISCGDKGGVSGACTGLNISCPNVTPLQPYDVTAKVTTPSGTSVGTIIFMTGGGGNSFYDAEFSQGSAVISTVVAAGFTAVQLKFDNKVAGWATGPAADGNGTISLACLPATAIQWVDDDELTLGTPLCATGNSGGADALAYGLAQYGLGSILSMIEPTSGPELARLDEGCSPNPAPMACATCGPGMLALGIGLSNSETFVDPAYTGAVNNPPVSADVCSENILGVQNNSTLLEKDSILSNVYKPVLNYTTDVHIVFGGTDTTGGDIPESLLWATVITSKSTIVCLPGVGHALPNFTAGATQIENDLITFCKLQ